MKLTTVTGAQMLSNADILNVPHKHLLVYNLHPRAGKPMLTNTSLDATITFFEETESRGSAFEGLDFDEREARFNQVSDCLQKEMRLNMLNTSKESSALYLCEIIEMLSKHRHLILPNNDEISAFISEDERLSVEVLSAANSHNEALSGGSGLPLLEIGGWSRKNEMIKRYHFRESIHKQLTNSAFNWSDATDEAWEMIASEQISFFLENTWLRVIELYERRCGATPEKLHWRYYNQWVSTPSLERVHLAVMAALSKTLLPKLPQPPAEISMPAVALTPAERACVAPFTLDEAAAIAHHIGLTDASGTYCLDRRKLGAVVGFCQALQHANKLSGSLEDLVAVIGPRLGVELKTRKAITSVAKRYYALTEKALTRLKQTR